MTNTIKNHEKIKEILQDMIVHQVIYHQYAVIQAEVTFYVLHDNNFVRFQVKNTKNKRFNFSKVSKNQVSTSFNYNFIK